MRFPEDQLNRIDDRTSGYCHLCQRKVPFENYGLSGKRGAWEVEHSVAQVRGGTHRISNLYAACIPCNRSKGARRTRRVLLWNGFTKAPLPLHARRQAKQWNAIGGGLLGAAVGSLFGPSGAWVGGAISTRLAHNLNPDSD